MKKIAVLKLGGHALNQKNCLNTLIDNINYLKSNNYNVVIVHGGTPSVNKKLKEKNIESKFINGYRVTTKQIMEVVEEAISIETLEIVKTLNKNGLNIVGLNGHDCNLIKCEKAKLDESIDYGYVGKIININSDFLIKLMNNGIIPVISPIGYDDYGNSYNINSDYTASEVALSISADYLFMITDINGVYLDLNNPNSRIDVLDKKKTEELIKQNIILPTMATKVNACLDYVKKLNNTAFIINSTQKINYELFNSYKYGTKIVNNISDFSVRLAHINDIKNITKVVKKSFIRYQENIDYKIDPYKEKYEDVFRQIDNDFVFVVIKDNNIIGSVRLKDLSNSIGRIYRLCILDEYQNLGIGSILINYVENYAYHKGINKLGLTTLHKVDYLSNFYKKNGYFEYSLDNKRNYTRSLMIKKINKDISNDTFNINLFM